MAFKMSRTTPVILERTQKQGEPAESQITASNNKAQEQTAEFRSVKIRKDVFELLKLYCMCHRQAPRDIVTGLLEGKLNDFRNQLEELRKKGVCRD